jgi:ABC-2 type transport system ATP-binding protein
MSAIRLENLAKTYRTGWRQKVETVALRGLTLEVREGEIFGFLGPNGAGKSTTIHLLLNLIRPTAGAAFLFDRPANDAQIHQRLGYLPESVNLHDYYSGQELLEFYAALTRVPQEARAARVAAMLEIVKLTDAAHKRVSRYSKGMLQRIGLAQAMLHNPDLLILDEPTSNLDPVGRKEVRDVLIDLKKQGKTILICSHVLSEVESICDRVAILQQGELKRLGTLQELSAPKGVRLTVAAMPAGLIAELAATAAMVTFIQGKIGIKCPDQATKAQVEALLRQHQVAVEQSEIETQSLEDIFFSVVGSASAL